MSQPFDLRKFLVDVFAPEPDERVAVIVDTPTENVPDNPEWESRRAMAVTIASTKLTVSPLFWGSRHSVASQVSRQPFAGLMPSPVITRPSAEM